MMRRRALALTLLSGLLLSGPLLSGCATLGGGAGSSMVGRTFLSTEVTGRTLVAGTRLELTFPERGKLAANAGCNHLFGSVSVDGDRLKVSEMGSTAMGCDQARDEQDGWLTAFLTAGPRFTLTGDELVLTGDHEVITFVDRKTAQPDQPLQGPHWEVVSLIDGQAAGSVPSGAQAFLEFHGDTVTGSDGCNRLSGKAVQGAGTIVFSDLVTSKQACAKDAAALEAAVLATLRGEVTMKIDSDRLELRNANGKGLDLRAATEPGPTAS